MIRFLQLMQLLSRAARLVLPWIGGLVLFMLRFMATTVVSFWGGVPRTVDTIANHWLDRAMAAGVPSLWARRLYHIFWALAFTMIFAGWVVLSYMTVFVFQLIF